MRKIQKTDNGNFIVEIDQVQVKKAGFDEKSELDITVQDNKIIIEKKSASLSEKNFDKVINKYSEVFKKLSKT